MNSGAETSPRQFFSLKAFLQGLAAVALVYAALFAWLAIRAPKTLEKVQNDLPQAIAAIAQPAPVEPQIAIAVETPPASKTLGSPPAAPGQKLPITALPPITVTPMAVAPITAGKTFLAVALPPAPIAGLYETTAQGRLPVVRAGDHMTPFTAYRQPFAVTAARPPLIAVVVADLGLSPIQTQDALATMPGMVTFDFSPYTFEPDNLVNEARAKGHEVWLTLPVESEDYPSVDTGTDTLLIGAPPPQNLAKLNQVLGSTVGYAGILASAKPAFLKSATDADPILTALYKRGLVLVDPSATPSASVLAAAKAVNAPYGAVDIWLDQVTTPEAIQAALTALEARARAQGSAVGIIHALPVSYQTLSRWFDTLPGKGITLAPLSALTKPAP